MTLYLISKKGIGKMADYTKIMRSYKYFLTRLGYNIIFDGVNQKDGDGLYVIKIENPDNPDEPKFAFYQITGEIGDLSAKGFESIVLKEKDIETFTKMIQARIKGSTAPKSDLVYGLLQYGYPIDSFYKDKNIQMTPQQIAELSSWINWKGGRNSKTREQIINERKGK